MQSIEQVPAGRWRMDLTIPVWGILTVLAALAVQTATIVWWASGVTQRVTTLEAAQRETGRDHEALARVDERTQDLVVTVNRIDQRLSQQENKR